MKKLRVSTIQTDLFWEDIDKNLNRLSQKIQALVAQTDLIILPEMFSTGFSMRPEMLAESPHGKTFDWLKQQAINAKAVVTGSYMVMEQGCYYNRLVWMEPNGKYQTYDKKHLFSLSDEPKHYTAGKDKTIISYKGWKIFPLICYDLRFPVWSRNVDNFDLLIYVANWPEKRAHHWRSLLLARAIENQAYTIGVNRVGRDGNDFYHSGDSSIIDYAGNVLCYSAHVENSSTTEIEYEAQQLFRNRFRFLADKDPFNLS